MNSQLHMAVYLCNNCAHFLKELYSNSGFDFTTGPTVDQQGPFYQSRVAGRRQLCQGDHALIITFAFIEVHRFV